MKNIRIPRPIIYISIIAISLIIGILIGAVITNYRNNEKPNPTSSEDNFIYLNTYNSEVLSKSNATNLVFTTYEDYRKYFDEDILTEKDFKKHNYVLIPITVNTCSESEITPSSYKIDGNNITVKVLYTASCGFCIQEYTYYLLEVEKDLKEVNLEINFKARNKPNCSIEVEDKPIIYLYPAEETDVTVTLGYPEKIITSYPEYKNNWQVKAYPDGTLIDANNRKYYGLYWEGNEHTTTITEEGFIVAGTDIISFLEEKLSILGLNEKETNEFIIYWLPKLQNNKYNYIRFETTEEINNYMPLNITPIPDSVIRVIMDYKPLEEKINIKEQKLTPSSRNGFTVVEWGGSLIN